MTLTHRDYERLADGFEEQLKPKLLKWFEKRIVDGGLELGRPKFNVLVGNALAHIFSLYSAYKKDYDLNEMWPVKPDVLSKLNAMLSSELHNIQANFQEVVFGGDDERLYIRFGVKHIIDNIEFSYSYDYGSNTTIHLITIMAADRDDARLAKTDVEKVVNEFDKLVTFELLKK